MVVWLCYRTDRGMTAVTIRNGNLTAAHDLLARLFDHGLPTGGTWYCETGTH